MEQSAKVMKGMGFFLHLTYSPDTNSYMDYHVNRSLENWLANRFYDEIDDLMADVKIWIASKNRNFFACGIRPPSKCEAVLDVDGGHVPKQLFEHVFVKHFLSFL
ncbi:unnamed protein product [Haemonchus placei]|uniref:Uncharacterized protein n=1 Tax=Haemonchus placei TaxID=6290 RepID=A0A0N4W6P4_HAEPC|nr:unnamed protein product [Haemonchus placei]